MNLLMLNLNDVEEERDIDEEKSSDPQFCSEIAEIIYNRLKQREVIHGKQKFLFIPHIKFINRDPTNQMRDILMARMI